MEDVSLDEIIVPGMSAVEGGAMYDGRLDQSDLFSEVVSGVTEKNCMVGM